MSLANALIFHKNYIIINYLDVNILENININRAGFHILLFEHSAATLTYSYVLRKSSMNITTWLVSAFSIKSVFLLP